jgi:radical SAM protein
MDRRKPVSVMWESTIACGLACKHCKAAAKKTPDPDELSTEEAEHLIDQIVEFGRPYPILRITGGNALLREDIFQIIEYAKERGLTVTIAPSTTPHLNRKNIERLKEASVDVVAMSIDGPDAESHDSFRGVRGTFDLMVKAARVMDEVGLPFRLLTTVTRFNARTLPEIFLLSKKMGAIGWYLYMLIPTGRAREEYELTPEEFEDVFNFVYDAMAAAIMPVNAIAGSEPFRRVAVMRRLVEEEKLAEEVLGWGDLYKYLKKKLDGLISGFPRGEVKSSYKPRDKTFGKGIFVSKNGAVFPSSFLPIEMGNVRSSSLVEIYHGAEILRDMQDPSKLKGRCRICEFNDICRGSRSRAYAVTGDYLAEDPYCAYQPGTLEIKWNNKAILEKLRVTNYSKPSS